MPERIEQHSLQTINYPPNEKNVTIDGIVYGTGIGKSKKEAEQKAAFDAYQKRAR